MFRLVCRTPLFCSCGGWCYFTFMFTHHSPVKQKGQKKYKNNLNTQQIIRNKNCRERIILNRFKCTSQSINLWNFTYMSFFPSIISWHLLVPGSVLQWEAEIWVRDFWTLHASILINVKILSAGDCLFVRSPNTFVFSS